jgi:hypothetical protein
MCQRSCAGHPEVLLLQAFVKTTSGQGHTQGTKVEETKNTERGGRSTAQRNRRNGEENACHHRRRRLARLPRGHTAASGVRVSRRSPNNPYAHTLNPKP